MYVKERWHFTADLFRAGRFFAGFLGSAGLDGASRSAGPDSIAFGKSGKLYVALAGYKQISVLGADGAEQARYSGPAANASNPSQPLPWANPSAIAFDDKSRSLLVANHAIFFPTPEQFFAIFDVFVDDKADHLNEPHIP